MAINSAVASGRRPHDAVRWQLIAKVVLGFTVVFVLWSSIIVPLLP